VGDLRRQRHGSFVLGVLAGAAVTGRPYLLAGSTGMGSFTTFSTWMLQSDRLAEEHDRRHLAAYVVGSLVTGLLAAELGRIAGRSL
jgi:CrcB protein